MLLFVSLRESKGPLVVGLKNNCVLFWFVFYYGFIFGDGFFTLYVYMFRSNFVGFYSKKSIMWWQVQQPIVGLLCCVARKVV